MLRTPGAILKILMIAPDHTPSPDLHVRACLRLIGPEFRLLIQFPGIGRACERLANGKPVQEVIRARGVLIQHLQRSLMNRVVGWMFHELFFRHRREHIGLQLVETFGNGFPHAF